jgi:hypothetical protein
MRSRRFIIFCTGCIALLVGILFAAPSAKRRKESIECGNYMVAIGSAARLWAADHGNQLPSDLLSMSNEVVTPKIFVCPGDHARPRTTNWAIFTPAQSSYEIVTPGLRDVDANGVFLRCKLHGHLGYADGTVFDGTRKRMKRVW